MDNLFGNKKKLIQENKVLKQEVENLHKEIDSLNSKYENIRKIRANENTAASFCNWSYINYYFRDDFEEKFMEMVENLPKESKNYFKWLFLRSLAIGLQLEMFENAYLSSVVHNQIANALKIKFSTRLFAESTLDIISSGEAISKLDKKFQDALINIQSDFLKCKCEDRPFCDCLQKGISEVIINERLKGKDPIDISNKLFRKYQIQVYPGDIFSWLDSYVKNLDAIKRIAKAFNRKKVEREAHRLIKAIENG